MIILNKKSKKPAKLLRVRTALISSITLLAFIYCIFGMMICTGCKTTRSVVKQSLKTDLSIQKDSSSSIIEEQHKSIDSSKIVTTVSNNYTAERIVQILFSKPDSTGKQAILSQTITERITESNLQINAKANVKSESITDKKQAVKTKTNVKQKEKETSTTKTTISGIYIPWWIYVLLLIIVIGYIFRSRILGSIIDLYKQIFKTKK